MDKISPTERHTAHKELGLINPLPGSYQAIVVEEFAQLHAELGQARETIEAIAAQRNRAIEDVETLRGFVAEAVEWSKAYPESVFAEPTPKQIDDVCKSLGFRIDRIAAKVLRDFTARWSDKASLLLAATEPKP